MEPRQPGPKLGVGGALQVREQSARRLSDTLQHLQHLRHPIVPDFLRGGVLQAQVVVGDSWCTARKVREGLSAGEKAGYEVGKIPDAGAPQAAANHGRGVESCRNGFHGQRLRVPRTHQEVVAPPGRFLPELAARKNILEGSDDTPKVLRRHGISLDPNEQDPPLCQAPSGSTEKLTGEEVGHARNPGVGGLGHD